MARAWSLCLGALTRRCGRAIPLLQSGRDGGFLATAGLAHLAITALGLGTLAARAMGADGGGAGPTDISVALFLITGAIAAALLWHFGRVTRAAATQPACDRANGRWSPPARRPLGEIPNGYTCNVGIGGLDRPIPMKLQANAAFSGVMSHVSHELRTPLNAIIGFADMMQRELLGPLGSPRYQEYVRHIRESGLAVLKAAEDTMAFTTLLAERERLHVQVIDLDALVAEACRQAGESAAARGIEIVRGATGCTLVRAEPSALSKALSHLIAAGVARTPAGQPVFVNLRSIGTTARVTITFDLEQGQPRPPAHASQVMARALLELQDVGLTERRTRHGGWRMTVTLPLAVARMTKRKPKHHVAIDTAHRPSLSSC